ncbi:MAG: putative LPS assembly protein LptD [Myxococcota bacterium]
MPAPGLAVLAADLIVIDAPITVGQGDVVITLDEQRAEAAAFTLNADTGALTLTAGRWFRSDAVLTFQQAEIDLGDLSGVLVEARLENDRFLVEGGSLTLIDEDTLSGADLVFTACRCETPTWSLSARAVTVELDKVARFTGGWLQICQAPILPIPAGMVPLAERRSGVLFPTLNWNQDGFIVGLPVYLTLGRHVDLTVEPEYRQQRGVRGRGSVRYSLAPGQGGTLNLAAGFDQSPDEQRIRGAGSWQHLWTHGPLRTAIDANYQSDPAYLADFGETFLIRSAPWIESRAVVGWGPLRVESDLFQADAVALQQPVGVVLSGLQEIGPVAAFGATRLDLFATGDDPTRLRDPIPRSRTSAQLSAGHIFPMLRTDLVADVEAIVWPTGAEESWGWGQLRGEARVPMWGDLGGLRHLAEVGVVGQVGGATREDPTRYPDERLPTDPGVGPVMSSRWLRRGGVPLSFRAEAPWTADGWQPLGVGRAQLGGWSGRIQAERALQLAEFGWGEERRLARASLIRSEGVLQGGGRVQWTLPGRWSAVALGWRHLYDFEGQQTQSMGPTIGYHSPCDCLDLSVTAIWSADRPVPGIGFSARIR